jgi:hypothetical protein
LGSDVREHDGVDAWRAGDLGHVAAVVRGKLPANPAAGRAPPISRPASGLEKSVPSPTKLEVMFEVAPISSAPSCWSRGSDVTAEQFTPIAVVMTHRGLPSLERSTNDFGWLG